MHILHLLRFGTFELDLHSRELRNGPTAVRLQRQPFEILCLMLEHRGTVVTREQLRQTLSGETQERPVVGDLRFGTVSDWLSVQAAVAGDVAQSLIKELAADVRFVSAPDEHHLDSARVDLN